MTWNAERKMVAIISIIENFLGAIAVIAGSNMIYETRPLKAIEKQELFILYN